MPALQHWLTTAPILLVGVVASFAASLGTSAGALPVFAVRGLSNRAQDLLLSTAAGIMLAATAFSLVRPGLALAAADTHSAVGGALVIGVAALAGAVVVSLVHRYAPHEHFMRGPAHRNDPGRLRQVWLFVIALTLHNFPEGLAVGVGFGGGNVTNGLALTSAIFLQNMPEGFVVALALRGLGYSRARSVGIACATGVVETFGGLFGALAVSLATTALPWGLGFAAGAMLFVISHEIIPGTHRDGYETQATFGLLAGFLLMLVVGAALD